MVKVTTVSRARVDIKTRPGADGMRQLSNEIIRTQAERIAKGIDLNDRPAKPLSRTYEKQKRKKGLSPIRDLHFTGTLMASRAVTNVTDGSAVIDFTDARAARKLAGSNMVGLSPSDQKKVDAEFEIQMERVNRR